MIDIISEWLKMYTALAFLAGILVLGLVLAVGIQLIAMYLGRKAEMVSEKFYYRDQLCFVEYNDHTGEIASMIDAKTGRIIPRPESLRVNLSGNSPTLVIDNDDKQR